MNGMTRQQFDVVMNQVLDQHPGVSDIILTTGKAIQADVDGELEDVATTPDLGRLSPLLTKAMSIAHATSPAARLPRPPLFTFRFLALCLFILLAYCNITVFYNFYTYLQNLGVPQGLRGAIIGSSSLATIIGFLIFTPSQSERNAPWAIFAGIAVLILCGVGYLFARGVWTLFALRLATGLGVALMYTSSSCTSKTHWVVWAA